MENQPNISFNPNCRPTPDKRCCRELTPPFRYPNKFICRYQIHALWFHFFTFHISFQFALIWIEWRHILWWWWWWQGPLKLSLVCFAKTVFSLPRLEWIKWIWSGEVWINKKRDILAHQKVLRHTFASCSSTQQHRFPTSCSFWKHVHTFIGRGDFDKCLYIKFFFLQSLVRLVQLRNMNAL